MKCFNHTDVDATGTCNDCGKGLCSVCISRFEFPLCESCLMAHNEKVKNDLNRGLAITGGILFIITLLSVTVTPMTLFESILFGYVMASAFWGWKFINEKFPKIYINPSFTAYVRGFLTAVLVGLFVAPYQIYKMTKEIKLIGTVKNKIDSGEI